MRFEFANKKIQELYTEEKGAKKFPPAVIDRFFEVMQIIEAAVDEQDLRQLKGLRYEKLKGQRGKDGERSIRLNRQFGLIVTVETDGEGRLLLIINIEDYH